MAEMITMKEVHEMLAEICEPIVKTIRELSKQVDIERARLGIFDSTGIVWLDEMIADRGKNGRS